VLLRIDGHGDLVVATDGGEVIFHKPVVYQQNGGWEQAFYRWPLGPFSSTC
jgi:hypothetical protein